MDEIRFGNTVYALGGEGGWPSEEEAAKDFLRQRFSAEEMEKAGACSGFVGYVTWAKNMAAAEKWCPPMMQEAVPRVNPADALLSAGYSPEEAERLIRNLKRSHVSEEELTAVISDMVAHNKPLLPDVPAPEGLMCAEDMIYEPPHWLLEPYFQIGKITLVQGDSGCGKTALMCAVAAHVTTGKPLMGLPVREAGPVLMLSVEDDPAILRGRFEADGGDVRNLYFLDSAYSLSFGSLAIEQAIRTVGARLVVFDPLQSFLGAGVDFHKANQTRPVMAALSAMAVRNHCAVAIVAHAGKAVSEKSPVYRSLGSVDIPAATRSILHVMRDPREPDEAVALHVKSSNAKAGRSLAFTIGERGRVEWRGLREVSLRDLEQSGKGTAATAREDCRAFILDVLKDGEMNASELDKRIETAGYSKTIRSRAKAELKSEGIICYVNSGFGADKKWMVSLAYSRTEDYRKKGA